MKLNNISKLVLAIAIPQLAGLVGSFFTSESIADWYVFLAKPNLAPPNWVFAPVWTTLFLLMGIAFYLIWRQGRQNKPVRTAMRLFIAQLGLNVIWSVLFFGSRNPGLALLEIVVLWLTILWTTALFFKISKTAGWLMVPYLLWVAFAAYLNYAITTLN